MKIRLISDIHNEFRVLNLSVMDDEKEQILILAGDIGVATDLNRQRTIIDFLEDMDSRFKKVIYVLGNHEFYDCNKPDVLDKIHEETDHLENTFILQDSFIDIDGVIFVGATLWTDLHNGNPLIINESKRGMNDYHIIKNSDDGYARFTPDDSVKEHHMSREYIFHIASENRDKKVVVISHHSPSYQSIHEKWRSSIDMTLNYNFFSDLDEQIDANDNIGLWVHGHCHDSFDYNIGKTRVACNPRGYSHYKDDQENGSFDPCLVLEV